MSSPTLPSTSPPFPSPSDSWRAWHFNLPWESSPLSQAGQPVWAAIDYYAGPWATRAPRGAAPLADARSR